MNPIPYVLEVGGQEVVLTPDPAHEFTATTEQVALGYGVSVEAIRSLKSRREEELLEGKHFVAVANRNAAGTITLWTKRGIVRLGFFIRSARARLFRDMAEDLVISAMQPSAPAGPALINAHGVAAALGCSRQSAQNYLSRAHIKPVAHYVDICPGYLYALEDVQAHWPGVKFEAFQGEALPGTAPVAQMVTARRNPRQPLPMPRLLEAAPVTDRVAAAQELVQIEQRRAYLLGVLA